MINTGNALWRTADGRIVEDGHREATFLVVGAGGYIPDAEAARLGINAKDAVPREDGAVGAEPTRVVTGVLVQNVASLDGPAKLAIHVVYSEGPETMLDPSSLVYRDAHGSVTIGGLVAEHQTRVSRLHAIENRPVISAPAAPTGLAQAEAPPMDAATPPATATVPIEGLAKTNDGLPSEKPISALGDGKTTSGQTGGGVIGVGAMGGPVGAGGPVPTPNTDPGAPDAYEGLEGVTPLMRAELAASGLMDAAAVKAATDETLLGLVTIGPDALLKIRGKGDAKATPKAAEAPKTAPADKGEDKGAPDPYKGVGGLTEPIREALAASGLMDAAAVKAATDETLLAVDGIGPAKLATIRGK